MSKLHKREIGCPQYISQAKKIQLALSKQVKLIPLKNDPEYIAGVDAAFLGEKVIATVCVFRYPELLLVEQRHVIKKCLFPYVPGYLSFREGPAIINVLERLKTFPHLIVFDGQGIAHPRGLGIASHIGVVLGIPTMGCAKSRLVGDFREPDRKKRSRTSLRYRGKTVGFVLRTRDGVRPLFLSPGHRIDFKDTLRIALSCIGKYRVLEPIRCAHILSHKLKQRHQ